MGVLFSKYFAETWLCTIRYFPEKFSSIFLKQVLGKSTYIRRDGRRALENFIIFTLHLPISLFLLTPFPSYPFSFLPLFLLTPFRFRATPWIHEGYALIHQLIFLYLLYFSTSFTSLPPLRIYIHTPSSNLLLTQGYALDKHPTDVCSYEV